MAEICDLPGRDILAIELAAEEAFLNICEHAYPDGTDGGVILRGEIAGDELLFSFADEGLPFDPVQTLKTDVGTRLKATDGPRLGLKLISHAVDEVHWINLGKDGKELRLVKRLSVGSATQTSAPQPAEIPQTLMQRYTIRPLCPDDALQVSRMFWLAYGYTYRFEQFYRPEGLLQLVQEGKLVSYVAVTKNDEVAGHAGLFRVGQADIAEMVALVVSPRHRGQGLQATLTDALVAKAKEMNLFGLSFGAVTSHAISQREVAKFGAQPCGLDLATIPPFGFKALGLEALPPQRESFLHCFKYLISPPPASAHVPERHKEIVEQIYAHLQRPLFLGEPDRRVISGNYSVSFNKKDNKGIILVKDADSRQWPEILRATVDLIDIAGADVLCLDLPLTQPETSNLCEHAEKAGYFFCRHLAA